MKERGPTLAGRGVKQADRLHTGTQRVRESLWIQLALPQCQAWRGEIKGEGLTLVSADQEEAGVLLLLWGRLAAALRRRSLVSQINPPGREDQVAGRELAGAQPVLETSPG